jgi:hypothetical protein
MRYRSKALATWLGIIAGALGAQRFYLHGARDTLAWLHPGPTLVGLWGAWRMHTLGQDDQLSWLLVPILGMMLSISMLVAIVSALTPDAGCALPGPRAANALGAVSSAPSSRCDRRHRLMGTIAFAGQRYFSGGWAATATGTIAS